MAPKKIRPTLIDNHKREWWWWKDPTNGRWFRTIVDLTVRGAELYHKEAGVLAMGDQPGPDTDTLEEECLTLG